MKENVFSILGIVLLAAFSSGKGLAGPITYTSKYTATVLPPTSGGTVAVPAFTLSSSGSGNSAAISSQKLVASTTASIANSQVWLIGGGNGTAGAWNISSATGGTVDFSVRVTGANGAYNSLLGYQGGFMIQAADGVGTWTLYFNQVGISILGGDIVDNSVAFPWRDLSHDNTTLKTYRLSFKGGRLSLFEAGSPIAIFSNIPRYTGYGALNRLYFGDSSSLVSGSYELGFIGWNTSIADFTPPDDFFHSSRYLPTVLPQNSSGTTLDPNFAVTTAGSGNIATLANGTLSASTLGGSGTTNQQCWIIGGGSGLSSAWNVSATTGASVDFNVRVTGASGGYNSSTGSQGGFMIQVGDGVGTWTFFFNTVGISVQGGSSSNSNTITALQNTTHDNQSFLTYRITFQNGLASLYDQNSSVPIFSDVPRYTGAGAFNRLYFGDGSGVISGAFDLNYLGWNRAMISASAPYGYPVAVNPYPLNNLVSTLIESNLSSDKQFSFALPKESWIYLKLSSTVSGAGYTRAAVNDKAATTLQVTTANLGLPEAMFYLPKGVHTVRVSSSGTATATSLTVRQIPEIAFFQISASSSPNAVNRSYSTLMSNGILQNYNVIGSSSTADTPSWRASGRKWMDIAHAPRTPNGSESGTWSAAMAGSNSDGVFVDEFVAEWSAQTPYYPSWATAITGFASNTSLKNKKFFGFFNAAGTTDYTGLFQAIAGGGYRIAPEFYARVPSDIDSYVYRTQTWLSILPKLQENMIYFIAPNNIARAATWHLDPAMNYKAFLEDQFYTIARDPIYNGLLGVGVWTSNNMDEDALRWCTRLTRHYLIQGNTGSLSNDSINMNHIQNPGFENSLTAWTVAPLGTTNVGIKNIGDLSFRRTEYTSVPEGAKVLWTQRSASAANQVSQTIQNLTVGKTYHVNVYAVDLTNYGTDSIITGSVTISGATALAAESNDTVTLTPAFAPGGTNPITLYCTKFHRKFVATSTTATLSISDWQSPSTIGGTAGQQIVWDFIDVANDVALEPVN